ncbi:peptidoglycan recognition protein family protein [Paenibacillus herberti]|uniref:N-acetylmuramoyl-L-alanine amidase n=1 Tax=Paenibacillus herberti TaxID=1619309 RepID=A0A229P045_9BACL|nr:N-acetylmuramoyl-L-alanine amidase [Paenibacillus herberti]OXM15239.1 N-acetylmuramoyl-L-alanine amidase [Paenibacillus herberti]
MNKENYPIERRYIRIRSNTRPGTRLSVGSPAFFVAHDTGNPGASADAHFRYFERQMDRIASAHVFIDDRSIIEIIPTGTGAEPAEKAYHVVRNTTIDNEQFGFDANDAAIGVELCYGGMIDFAAAYDRFAWYMAYCCNKWGKLPSAHIVSHKQLDPSRKTDCEQSLTSGGVTFGDLIRDVAARMNNLIIETPESKSEKLPLATCDHLIRSYVQPAWHERKTSGDAVTAEHYARLAANLRQATTAGAGLAKSNAQEVIYNWLSPAWLRARQTGRDASFYHRMADELRACAGIPLEKLC